jgi:hypothetical protein
MKREGKPQEKPKSSGGTYWTRRLYRDCWAVVDTQTGRVVDQFIGQSAEQTARQLAHDLNTEGTPEHGLSD